MSDLHDRELADTIEAEQIRRRGLNGADHESAALSSPARRDRNPQAERSTTVAGRGVAGRALTPELREQVRRARDEAVRARIGSYGAAEKLERDIERDIERWELDAALADDRSRPKDYEALADVLTDELEARADWLATRSVDVREHLSRVATVVTDAHRRGSA